MARHRQKYTLDDRETALAALAANAGNIAKTAKQLGVAPKTLWHWTRGTRPHEKVANRPIYGSVKKGALADALETVAWKLAESLAGKVDTANLLQAATAMGIAIDKARLLRDQPTNINAPAKLTHEQRAQRLQELAANAQRRRLAALNLGGRDGAGPPVGTGERVGP
jgi:transposase-like protein